MIKKMDNKTRFRDNGGIDDDVKISDIRDGAYTAAVESGADITLAKLLGGHATGMSDYPTFLLYCLADVPGCFHAART